MKTLKYENKEYLLGSDCAGIAQYTKKSPGVNVY